MAGNFAPFRKESRRTSLSRTPWRRGAMTRELTNSNHTPPPFASQSDLTLSRSQRSGFRAIFSGGNSQRAIQSLTSEPVIAARWNSVLQYLIQRSPMPVREKIEFVH